MSLRITVENNEVLLEYSPDNGTNWILEKFQKDENLSVKKTFSFTENDLVGDIKDEASFFEPSKEFRIGVLEGNYYQIFSRVLGTTLDVLFHRSIKLKVNFFIVNNDVSILRKFEKLAHQQIVIGGEEENSVPIEIFNDILNSFPTRTEQKHYVDSRITNVLSQYLEGVKDSGRAFERYLENRNKIGNINTIPSLKNYELEKYQFILQTLENMLGNSDQYSENDWQVQILEILLLLYPKYIKCFSNVHIKDFYTDPNKPKNRYIDLMLVDSNGNVDVIEIKKPFPNCVVSTGTYRANYIPMKELSGSIMQVEKYIFHLNKWGASGEKALSNKYKSELPTDLTIRITNPKGIIILGRDSNLSQSQLFDLEIIKRKYGNVFDIITYDDLIRRLKNILQKFKE